MTDRFTKVTFTWPAARTAGTKEPGGAYSLYSGAIFPGDGNQQVVFR